MIKQIPLRKTMQFTEKRNDVYPTSALLHARAVRRARRAVRADWLLKEPPRQRYIFFALHLQPESSVDVWAPFFSNQKRVVELISRSTPPSHKLLVKLHKSDAVNYTEDYLRELAQFPGVEIVQPFANTREFIERTDLAVVIQGTIGLEAALLGKPVIMLGESRVSCFPSVSSIGRIQDLPSLVREKLGESPPSRQEIISAYSDFLRPFLPASLNNWRRSIKPQEIDGYVTLFDALQEHLTHGAIQ